MISLMRHCAVLLLLSAACPGPSDVHLDPPRDGFQLATDSFPVPRGEEVQRCNFFRVPGSGTDPVFVSRFVAAVNEGSHHMNVFRVKTILALDGEDGQVVAGGECWKSGNWADWPLVFNSQEGGRTVDWTLPSGVVHRFAPGEKLMLQSHFVNAATQKTPGRGKAVVNFEQVHGGPFAELGTVFRHPAEYPRLSRGHGSEGFLRPHLQVCAQAGDHSCGERTFPFPRSPLRDVRRRRQQYAHRVALLRFDAMGGSGLSQ